MALEKIVKRIEIEMSGHTKRYAVSAKQGDKATRYVEISLTDQGEPYEIPDEAEANAYVRKPDGKKVYAACEHSGNIITLELNNQMLAAAGTALCEIEIQTEDMTQEATSITFEIEIEKKVKDENAIESSDEFTAFEKKMKEYAEAEAKRVEQETARVTAETERKAAETKRVEQETARTTAETNRKNAEAKRVEQETARVTAETERKAAETERVEQETARQQQAQQVLDKAEMATGMASELTETLCRQLLDGSNTTEIFWKWYRSATAQGETDKYAILCRFADAAALAWNEKTYTLRNYKADVSGLTAATPMDDLADKPAAQLCTEKTTPVEDWADEDPMTWYIRANANSMEDGTMEITFFEGEDGFDLSGESAPVYTFSLALWLKEWNDDQYNYISFRTTRGSGFYPDAADVGLDNKKRSITWHPTFPGILDSNGALTSGAGGKAYIFASGTQGNQKAKAKNPCEGLWNDCDTKWALRTWQLRHFDLENSGIAEGCTSYNYQYMAAAPEENVKRVLLTASQAANFLIGSTVSVGEMGTNTSKDRYNAWMRNLAHLVHVVSIEKVTVDGTEYTAVNLDTETAFTTTATTCISTMPWDSGITEQLPGHKDGCTYSLTAGKTPLRVAGVEFLDGAYAVGLDPLYKTTANSDGGYDYEIYECRDSQKLSGSITADYVNTGITYTGMPSGWNYVKEFVRTRLGVLFPKTIKGSSTTYYKSAFYGTSSAGVRCPWRFASLSAGGAAGLAAEYGYAARGSAYWYCRPRLCGAGKKRGEWPE